MDTRGLYGSVPAAGITARGRCNAWLEGDRARERRMFLKLAALLAIVLGSFWLTGLFDLERLAEGIPAIIQIGSEMVPPDFACWQAWMRPLLDTLAMSVAGTAFAVVSRPSVQALAQRHAHRFSLT